MVLSLQNLDLISKCAESVVAAIIFGIGNERADVRFIFNSGNESREYIGTKKTIPTSISLPEPATLYYACVPGRTPTGLFELFIRDTVKLQVNSNIIETKTRPAVYGDFEIFNYTITPPTNINALPNINELIPITPNALPNPFEGNIIPNILPISPGSNTLPPQNITPTTPPTQARIGDFESIDQVLAMLPSSDWSAEATSFGGGSYKITKPNGSTSNVTTVRALENIIQSYLSSQRPVSTPVPITPRNFPSLSTIRSLLPPGWSADVSFVSGTRSYKITKPDRTTINIRSTEELQNAINSYTSSILPPAPPQLITPPAAPTPNLDSISTLSSCGDASTLLAGNLLPETLGKYAGGKTYLSRQDAVTAALDFFSGKITKNQVIVIVTFWKNSCQVPTLPVTQSLPTIPTRLPAIFNYKGKTIKFQPMPVPGSEYNIELSPGAWQGFLTLEAAQAEIDRLYFSQIPTPPEPIPPVVPTPPAIQPFVPPPEPESRAKIVNILTDGNSLPNVNDGETVPISAEIYCKYGETITKPRGKAYLIVDGAVYDEQQINNGYVTFRWSATAVPFTSHNICVKVPPTTECQSTGQDCKRIYVNPQRLDSSAQLAIERASVAEQARLLQEARRLLRSTIIEEDLPSPVIIPSQTPPASYTPSTPEPANTIVYSPPAQIISSNPINPVSTEIPITSLPNEGSIELIGIPIPIEVEPVFIYLDNVKIGRLYELPKAINNIPVGTHIIYIGTRFFTSPSKTVVVSKNTNTRIRL